MTTVSVIIPCYNAERTIAQTLDSVIGQTFGDFEAIVADDCSFDNSCRIVEKYMSNDNRIILLRSTEPSGSPTEPRNRAISYATGRYIAFLDSDDMWLPTKLENQLNTIKQYDTPFVFSNYEKVNFNGDRASRVIVGPSKVDLKTMYYGNPIGCLTVMIDRETFPAFKFTKVGHEDCVAWIELLKTGITAYNTQTVEALYRQSDNSVSSDKLKILSWQWAIYRKTLNFGVLKSIYYYIHYAVRALIKRKK